jgi:ferredoxin-fold anticodon binding domain-containing protein
MGIERTPHYYCAYARKGFEIYNNDFESHWRCQLGNETIVTLRTFEHYVAMSYYDYYIDEEGVTDYQSIRFRFRIYNCTTKNKIVER